MTGSASRPKRHANRPVERRPRDATHDRSTRPVPAGTPEHVLPAPGSHLDLAQRLRDGRKVFDFELDRVFSLELRKVSSFFWTPVSVALRAAELLVDGPATRVLDVGSGIGKFCLIGAAATGASFTGVEHRERFVRAARDAADRMGLGGVSFVHGTFDRVDVASFDAIYFFNPFEENVWVAHEHVDRSVELSEERYAADVLRAEQLLSRARVGTRVVTYHGFGGVVPSSYSLTLRERRHSGILDLWTKTEESPAPSGPPRLRLVSA